MKTLAVINNKGGVGKTTTAVHLAAGMARRGKDVLLVDLDSQGSASLALGVDRNDLTPSTAEVLFEEVPLQRAVRSTKWPSLDLLTGSLELSNADTYFSSDPNREERLRDMLAPVVDDYDLIVLDCAPSTSSLTINALVTADAFIIPTSPSYLSLEGIVSLGEVVTNVRRTIGKTGPILGILITMVAPDNQDADAIQALREHYGGKVFETIVRRDDALEDAPAHGETVFEYAPDSMAAEDYTAVLDEVESRLVRYGSMVDRITNKKATDDRSSSNDASRSGGSSNHASGDDASGKKTRGRGDARRTGTSGDGASADAVSQNGSHQTRTSDSQTTARSRRTDARSPDGRPATP